MRMSFLHLAYNPVIYQIWYMESPDKDLSTVQSTTPKRSIWRELNDAIRGTDADYTRIDLKRAILLLAVPMIMELVMESTFAVLDIYFVGQLGASAVATVGLTETYLFLLYYIAMRLSMAVTGHRCPEGLDMEDVSWFYSARKLSL